MAKPNEMKKRVEALYVNSFINWITNGAFILEERLSSVSIKALYDRYLTQDRVTKVYSLSNFKYNYQGNLVNEVKREFYEVYPMCNLVFSFRNEIDRPPIDNMLFLNRMEEANEKHDRMKRFFASFDEFSQRAGKQYTTPTGMRVRVKKSDVELLKAEADSYNYVYDKVSTRTAFYQSNIFVHMTAPTNKILRKANTEFLKILRKHAKKSLPIKGLLHSYLANMGPASSPSGPNKYPSSLLSSENLVSLLPYDTKGLVNDRGVIMGVDLNNSSPFLLDFFNSGTGQTVMYLGKTGSGKTYAAFETVLGLLGHNVHTSVIDLKGNEWDLLGKYCEYTKIDLDGPKKRFVNTLRLDDITVPKSHSKYMYELAVDGTCTLFMIMSDIGPSEGSQTDLRAIFKESVMKLFNDAGVVASNPDSFINTRNLKLGDILRYLNAMESSTGLSEGAKRTLSIAKPRIINFTSGVDSESFKDEITLGEFLDSPLTILALNKNSNQDLTVLDNVKVFMGSYIITKKNEWRKMQSLHSCLVAEEIQRLDSNGAITKFINSTTTGSRSQNVMVLLLLNVLDKLNDSGLGSLKSNISTFVVGKVQWSDIEILHKNFNLPNIIPLVQEISKENSGLKHAFACSYDTGSQNGFVLYRAVLPPKMGEGLATRTKGTGGNN